MNKPIKVILSEDIKVELLEKQNQACNTFYKISDISYILEYVDHARNINLLEIVFNDYTNQRYFKDSLKIDNIF